MAAAQMQATAGLSLAELRRQFHQYEDAKKAEIDEQRMSWRYYHSAQWTQEQLDTLKKRKQPAITFDRISRKIDGLVGTVRRLRTDPKAYPRTQAQEDGAEVATQTIRYLLDAARFEDLEAECARDGSVHGIGVCELEIVDGDRGDPDIGLNWVDPRTFFYDPRSVKPDFSDARFMGVAKWATKAEIVEAFPQARDILYGGMGDGEYETDFSADSEQLWTDEKDRLRLVDHWYIQDGTWRYSIHVGTVVLMEGDTQFFDQKRRPACKFIAYACGIDHDGDHYGFVRRMKGPQDAMNQHRSKSMHIMNTRQLIARKGTFGDPEKARIEMQKPDGIIEFDTDKGDFEITQPAQEFLQQTQYYEDAKQEIENFGPNLALVGTGANARSGRALSIMQQSGLAELGPYLKNFRMWKLTIYRRLWIAAQTHWKSERWVRVLDDEQKVQFFQVNALQFDEYGQPQISNALGSIDVDIIIDEGPDTETMMGDVFDTLGALASNQMPIPPQVIIEASSLPSSQKKRLISLLSQPDPEKQQAQQVALAGEAAKVEKTKADTGKALAETVKTEMETAAQGQEIAHREVAAVTAMQQPIQPEPQAWPSY